MDNLNMNTRLGTKWFTFYTKVRPWFACLSVFTVISDFVQYQEVYTSYWWMMVYFLAALIQPVLCIVVFVKSKGDYEDFVRFVKGVLLFETFNLSYGQAVKQYVQTEFDIEIAIIVGVVAFLLLYFIWYCLNMKYFKKRINIVTNEHLPESPIRLTEEQSVYDDKISFCRKCGNKLLDGAKFCNKCGTEVIKRRNNIMKRGIFRIIAGIIMILSQLSSMMVLISEGGEYISADVWYNVGFYSIGTVGIVLLIFGISAYKKGLRSQIVLHTKSRKFHTFIKWVMFVVTVLLCVDYVVNFIQNFDSLIYTLLIIFATLSFAVYLLFYIYKKPCCLPSACLIFMGLAYTVGVLSNIKNYLILALEFDSLTSILILEIISRLITGILFIVLASKLYKERFSVKAIKTIGWITFVLEVFNSIIYPVIINFEFSYFYFNNLSNVLYVLFVLGVLLFISAFKINTLAKSNMYNANDIVRFCRKCGDQLVDGSKFCRKCGTEIVDIQKGID